MMKEQISLIITRSVNYLLNFVFLQLILNLLHLRNL